MSGPAVDAWGERIGPLEALIGTWAGKGVGVYPTIEEFGYQEQITITDGGVKPFVAYQQRTSASDDGRPLHAESGYLRWAGGAPEWVIASPTGVAEVHAGTVDEVDGGLRFHFRTVAMAASATAKPVTSVERIVTVRGEELSYELHMGAVGLEHQLHLTASLRRSGDSLLP